MSGSLNKVILIGRLGSDPQIRTQNDGNNMAVLSVATSEYWKDRTTNERREKTEWHRIVIFNPKLVDIISQYARKGQNVYVEGQMQTRKWTDTATQQPRSIQEVVLRAHSSHATFLFLDNREQGSERRSSEEGMYEDFSAPSSLQEQVPTSAADDDEIPF